MESSSNGCNGTTAMLPLCDPITTVLVVPQHRLNSMRCWLNGNNKCCSLKTKFKRRTMKRRNFLAVAGACATSTWMHGAQAQIWPEKPLRFVLSQPAGSGPVSYTHLTLPTILRV